MLNCIVNNPYRILGILSNSTLKERVANQNKLNAFGKVGKDISFPNDFIDVIPQRPLRTVDSVSKAIADINLDKDQFKHAIFWFINGSAMDEIALKHLQSGNREKAKDIFQKRESFSSLINSGILAFIDGDTDTGLNNLSKVIHDSAYRSELLQALGIANQQFSEDDLAELIIAELLKEIPASKLLAACTNPTDRAILSKRALDEPISAINSAISVAKNADPKDPEASLAAGTKLMNSTKAALRAVRDIAGALSPQYQMVADNVAKQVLQCGINYYNNAPDSDVESPRKAMVLQSYALSIAVGQLTKDRCKENYDILKQAVDNMPPTEVAIETRQVKEELRIFCQLPDKISHSVTLLNSTKPLLQTIKSKLGTSNSFYLSLSTQVVGNALHNVIEEVNQAQNVFGRMIEECKRRGINPSLVGSTLLDNIKPVIREAWKVTLQMDSFDMEYEFKTKRYNPNRQSLKGMCEDLGVSTYYTPHVSPAIDSKPSRVETNTQSTSPSICSTMLKDRDMQGCLAVFICVLIGGIIGGINGVIVGGVFIGLFVGLLINWIMGD